MSDYIYIKEGEAQEWVKENMPGDWGQYPDKHTISIRKELVIDVLAALQRARVILDNHGHIHCKDRNCWAENHPEEALSQALEESVRPQKRPPERPKPPRSYRQRALRIEPIADRVAALILARSNDSCLCRSGKGKVKVLTAGLLSNGSTSKRTLEGRRRRFNLAMETRLSPSGWQRHGAWWECKI